MYWKPTFLVNCSGEDIPVRWMESITPLVANRHGGHWQKESVRTGKPRREKKKTVTYISIHLNFKAALSCESGLIKGWENQGTRNVMAEFVKKLGVIPVCCFVGQSFQRSCDSCWR